MTWFDALLITLLAMIVAFGARSGLVGLFWGISGMFICLIVNVFNLGIVLSFFCAIFLGTLIAWGMSLFVGATTEGIGTQIFGGLGGMCTGVVLVITLSLGFPLQIRSTSNGQEVVYPSQTLTPFVYQAVKNSFIKQKSEILFYSSRNMKMLFIPDRVKRK